MSNRSTYRLTPAQFVAQMTDQMEQIARTLSAWAQSEPRTLQDLETHGVRLLHDLGTALLTAGEPDTVARSLLNGLTGWLKRIVRSGIDRMIQARHSGQMSIDEALRLSLARLEAGGTP